MQIEIDRVVSSMTKQNRRFQALSPSKSFAYIKIYAWAEIIQYALNHIMHKKNPTLSMHNKQQTVKKIADQFSVDVMPMHTTNFN
jgi:hypothetical protein